MVQRDKTENSAVVIWWYFMERGRSLVWTSHIHITQWFEGDVIGENSLGWCVAPKSLKGWSTNTLKCPNVPRRCPSGLEKQNNERIQLLSPVLGQVIIFHFQLEQISQVCYGETSNMRTHDAAFMVLLVRAELHSHYLHVLCLPKGHFLGCLRTSILFYSMRHSRCWHMLPIEINGACHSWMCSLEINGQTN